MVERVLEYDMLTYFLDESYPSDIPPYYSTRRDNWDMLNAEHMGIERIKNAVRNALPWESVTETLERLQDEAAVDLGCSLSMGKRNKRTMYYFETIYYTINDVLNYLYLCGNGGD